VWWCSLAALLHAQTTAPLKFEQVAAGPFTSEIEVTDIVQDQLGFLWIGTKTAGLYRYDGYSFVAYKHDPQQPASLGRNEVYRLLVDRAGQLWVSLDGGGVDRFDPQINGFIHYRHDPKNPASLSHDFARGMWQDRAGQLWIGTSGGVNLFNPATNGFTHYRYDPANPQSLSHNVIYRVMQDKGGDLWFGTGRGVDRFDSATQHFQRFNLALNGPPSELHAIRALAEDHAGNLWCGGVLGGLYRYERATGSFKLYRHDAREPASLGANSILDLLVDSQGVLWVGLQDGGLDRYDPATDSFVHFRKEGQNPHSLTDDYVNALFEDRAGVLWIGTRLGLCKYDRFAAHFAGHAALSQAKLIKAAPEKLLEDQAGQLWIGTDQGLARFDPASGHTTVFRHDPARADSLSESIVYALYQDRAGRLWVGGPEEGINLYLPERQRFKRYPIIAGGKQRGVFAIYEDRRGRLLVGTWQTGLQQYDAASDSFVPFQPTGFPQAVNRDTVVALTEDRAGGFWLGTLSNGVVRYDPATERWTNYRHQAAEPRSLSDDRITAFCLDRLGRLWITTYNGLNRFEPQTESFTRYTTRDGLPDAYLGSVQEDRAGRLWIGTEKGLARFDPGKGLARVYDTNDGLPSNRLMERGTLLARRGELFFGTLEGLLHFNPDSLPERATPLTLVLTEIRKFEQPFQYGPDISRLASLDFTWQDDMLSFDFAALGLAQPQKTQYAWKLDGYDRDWIFGGRKRTATYTNLPGGRYTLRVKATDDEGRWFEKELAVAVSVTAPPWQRWWAYTLYVLTLAGAIFGYVRFKTQAQLKRVQELDTLVTQRTEQVREKNSQLEQTLAQLNMAQSELQEANEDLLAVLDQLRLGVLVAEPDGTVAFLSQAAQHLLNATQEKAAGQPWPSLLPLQEQEKTQLKALLALPEKQRSRLPIGFQAGGGRRYQLEIEIADDPRNPQRKIFYLYDVSEIYDLRRLLDEKAKFHELIGESTAMRVVFKQARDVAQTDTTVLLEGETGTGKELLARAIHYSGPRKSQPFIALNCAGLTESLLSSQLFGHKRGAFTGAITDQLGLFEAANGGTLFLDEIGDIPLTVQTALLRVLQEREITRLGENKPRKVDVRIITATHRDLNQRVAQGAFREDFLYRIRVARLKLPPLRERLEDLPLLVSWFLGQFRVSFARPQLDISTEAMDCLLEHAWPGNVRELRSAIESAVIKCRGSVIQPSDLPPEVFGSAVAAKSVVAITGTDERQRLIQALKQTNGNRAAAARLLGISRPTLYRRLKEAGLDGDDV
jgi:transcriptional regulator with PAS, ATPase and Fis domain/ligand-binding sensor domain-containing protein